MRIARFASAGADPRFGIVELSADGGQFPDTITVIDADPLAGPVNYTGERLRLADVRLLAPVIPRSKVLAVGKNYADHAAEFDGEVPPEPLIFLKPNTAVIGPGDAIVRPPQSERTDFEGELAAVIGIVTKNVPAERALEHVFGFTIANDVTARDLQRSDGQWSRAKGFDTFCPLGPAIETEFDLDGGAVLTTRLNGEVRQQAPISDMVHSVADVIAYASAAFTLLPGDVVLTGTPAGVGPFVAGDVVEVEITGLGILRNTARDA